MIIDFHTHTFPDKIAANAISHLQSLSHTPAYTDGTMAGLKDSMQKANIDYSVVLPVITNPAKAEHINSISIGHDASDGLIYFGGIHPDTENWSEELTRLSANGVKGIKIHPHYQNTDIDDIRYLRILDNAAQLGLIVVIHSGDDPAYPGIVRCSPEMVRRALNQVSGGTVVLAHMGGMWNWDRVIDNLADTGAYIDTCTSLGMLEQDDTNYYTESQLQLMNPEQFIEMVHAFGADRVLFGSDSPWADQRIYAEAVGALPLTQEELDRIFFKNACRLLSI